MGRRIGLASLVGLLLFTGCVRLNSAFEQGETDAGEPGESAESTVGSTRGSESDAASDTRASDSDSDTRPSTSDGPTTDGDATTDGTSHGGTSESEGETEFDTEAIEVCAVVPSRNDFCNTTNESCQSGTCAPWSAEFDGELEGTFCLPAGPLMDGDTCDPVCTGDVEFNCGPGLVCDVYSGPPQCRPTCQGPALSCDSGICLRYYWEDEDGNNTVTPLSFCKGECDPAGPELGGCQEGEACVIPEDGRTLCVPEESPGEVGDGCTESACGIGLVCVPGELVPQCEDEACCYEACSFESPVCPAGNCTVTIDVPFADEISVGFCPPPP